jgi:DNA-binding MarR family transcriptional regulator
METITISNALPDLSLTELFELIDQTAKNLRRIQRKTVKATGLTPPQYAVLNFLWERDKRPFKELADLMLCSRPTITGIIDTLEKKGLVARMPNPEDRRSILASLTDKGRRIQQETPQLETIYNSCCGGLTPLENHQLSFLLNKLNNSIILEEVNNDKERSSQK